MAVDEKPGVKSSSSIVPCFLFVEVRKMKQLSLLPTVLPHDVNNTFQHENLKSRVGISHKPLKEMCSAGTVALMPCSHYPS